MVKLQPRPLCRGFRFSLPLKPMSAKHIDAPLPETIKLGASPSLALWIVLATTGAVGLVILYLPFVLCLSASLLLTLYGWQSLRLHALLTHPSAVVAIRWGGSAINYQLRDGQWLVGNLQNGGLVTRWVTVMRVRDDVERRCVRYIVLTPDRISAQGFRLSRRHMLWDRPAPEGQA